MAGYIGSKASVVNSGAERKTVITATAGQTSLTGLSYTPTQVHVFQNGVRLVDGTDYTATNGSSITLTVGASTNDQIVVVSYATVEISDAVSASSGGTFSGNVVVNDTITTTNFTTTNIKATGETASRSATGVAAMRISMDTANNTILGSENVTSITDNATGDHSVNITNAMSNNNYTAQITGNMNYTSSGVYVFGFYDNNSSNTAQNYKSASLLRISGRFASSSSSSAVETDLVCASVIGDLA